VSLTKLQSNYQCIRLNHTMMINLCLYVISVQYTKSQTFCCLSSRSLVACISTVCICICSQYYYSIKDISVGGQCICYGHARYCPIDPVSRVRSILSFSVQITKIRLFFITSMHEGQNFQFRQPKLVLEQLQLVLELHFKSSFLNNTS